MLLANYYGIRWKQNRSVGALLEYQQYFIRMVTFVCEYCDLTLKKKQVDNHIRGRCSPASMICIDCSQVFYGNDHKNHTSCISEQDKHWGDFAPKKTKQIAKQPKNQNNHTAQPSASDKANGKQSEHNQIPITKKASKDYLQVPAEDEQEQDEWKGWKNEIKSIIRERGGRVQKQQLRKALRKAYNRKSAEELSTEQLSELLQEKVSKIKNIRVETYYCLE